MSSERDEVDFRPLVRVALTATTVALIAKLGSALYLAANRDVSVEIRFYRHVIPYLAFLMERSPYLHLAATSTLVMAVVVTGCFVGSLLRSGRQQYIAGWLAGPVATVNTVLVDVIRNVIDPPYVLWSVARWTLLCLLAAAALTGAWLAINRPWDSQLPAAPDEAADEGPAEDPSALPST
jgi:hypothetical protein